MTVTSSISHRNAISGGVSPGGRGNAMVATRADWLSKSRSSLAGEDAPRQ
jgi:hypothetical protein